MAVKPIDLQSNISQIIEVGRSEQARADAVVGQQHVLENESGDKARLTPSKMEELKKGENAVIRDQQKEEKKREQRRESKPGEGGGTGKKERRSDDRMGHIIDILK
ncbi:MAG: hypothetical protein A2W19_16185 [Spirochaetes bacterium RBG_16_49_21]|nr:MAG: hypothetical protein A2W19_16185 [Spirochaetes bacterium RBG_16_49_21]